MINDEVDDTRDSTMNWSPQEIANIELALNRTGTALDTLLDNYPGREAPDPETAFNRIIVESDPGYLFLVRANVVSGEVEFPHPFFPDDPAKNLSYDSALWGVCTAFEGDIDAQNPQGIPQVIVCNGDNYTVTEFTVVHEFGHLLDYRNEAENVLKASFENITLTSCPTIEFTVGATPTALTYRIMGVEGNAWDRGSRGWGSGPGFSAYQQHPSDDPTDEILEATADMFLNWVYRVTSPNSGSVIGGVSTVALTPPSSGCTPQLQQIPANAPAVPQSWNGFQNIAWLQPAPQLMDWGWPGDIRYAYMIEVMNNVISANPW